MPAYGPSDQSEQSKPITTGATSSNRVRRAGKGCTWRKLQLKLGREILGIGCNAHIIHNTLQTAVDCLLLDLESFAEKAPGTDPSVRLPPLAAQAQMPILLPASLFSTLLVPPQAPGTDPSVRLPPLVVPGASPSVRLPPQAASVPAIPPACLS
ncbi:hypothetical protein DPX16_3781 [Anabarilius grahami]|uniref:Uncharacterized protein n=1 Tax=Anabarilius grahami TaxID=495550 RepID=A0A3N0XEX9_ANAGA|nr:hypothetical protein DPX16_3781 [Anabarilius grahami]